MPMFYVYVQDNSEKRYYVEAETAEEAQEIVEASDDSDLVYETVDGLWEVKEVLGEEELHQRQSVRGRTP